jgi:hypothetical protein
MENNNWDKNEWDKNEWDKNEWQGKRKNQVEYSKTIVGVIIIIVIIVWIIGGISYLCGGKI